MQHCATLLVYSVTRPGDGMPTIGTKEPHRSMLPAEPASNDGAGRLAPRRVV
jgi:hypothetical protein